MSLRCRPRASASSIALWSEGARDRMSHVLADHKLHNLGAGRQLAAGAGAAEDRRSRSRCSGIEIRLRDATTPRSSASRTSSATGWCGRAARAAAAGEFHRRGDQPRARRSGGACRPRHRALRRAADHRGGRRAARLPRNPLRRRRRQALSCRSRTSSCCRATARRKRPSSSTGSAAAAGRRAKRGMKNRIREIARRTDQDRGGAAAARSAAPHRRARRVRRVLRRLPLRRRPTTSWPPSTRCSTTSAPGRPMDRLVCGDVGFGKTEVALRARLHRGDRTASRSPSSCRPRCWRASTPRRSSERFRGFPVKVAQASRLVPTAELSQDVRAGAGRRQRRHRDRHPCAARQE